MSRIDELFEGLPTHLTVDQLAAILGNNRVTVYRWLQSGELPGIKLGKTWIILRDEVRDYLMSKHNQTRPSGTAGQDADLVEDDGGDDAT
ncbi:helix-turn-helix domain-containing protein [Arthrobacter sp. SF27]|nr:helix-turn-helix domain-containing protein [Arthrobacter sp. SF27]NMR32477.1 helix-turn-helix domain-containing protein [Arthrobacter sp. SF27]